MPNGDAIFQNFEDLQHAQGPLMGSYLMLDDVSAADVGWWKRWPFKQGSCELTGTPTGEVKLLISNAPVMPANGYTILVGGSATATDTVSATLNTVNGAVEASYTVQALDTLDDVAAGLAAALAAVLKTKSQDLSQPADLAIFFAAFKVTAALAVITITNNADTPHFDLSTSTNVGATETLTVAQYDSGLGVVVPGVDLTANGLVQFSAVAAWFKVAATTLSAGNANVVVNGYS